MTAADAAPAIQRARVPNLAHLFLKSRHSYGRLLREGARLRTDRVQGRVRSLDGPNGELVPPLIDELNGSRAHLI